MGLLRQSSIFFGERRIKKLTLIHLIKRLYVMSKIGRNDVCPCGSGKKYKKCCLRHGQGNIKQYASMPIFKQYPQEKENHSIVTLDATPFNETGLNLENKVLNYIKNTHPTYIKDATSHAATILFRLMFIGHDRQSVDNLVEQAIKPFIIPWALYNWVPDLFEQMEQDRDEKNIKDKTIALEFNQQKNINLTSSEADLFNKLNTTYFSYYKVKNIGHDGSIILVDLLFDIEHHIFDKQLEPNLNVGGIIYARIVCYEGKDVIYGIWPMLIPEIYSERIDDFKMQCIKLNDNQPLVSHLFRTRFEFDSRDILSLIIVNMVEHGFNLMNHHAH